MSHNVPFNVNDVVELEVEYILAFGLFCKHGQQPVTVLITELSHIPSFNSPAQFTSVGEKIEARIIWMGDGERPPHASVKAVHPENDPWSEAWSLQMGDEFDAEIIRRVAAADRCEGAQGYLVALRPGAFAMLCREQAGLKVGARIRVRIEEVDEQRHNVRLTLVDPAR